MRLCNRKYMTSDEFKTRQLWLGFCDTVGIMLKLLEPAKASAFAWLAGIKRKCRTGWSSTQSIKLQLQLTFDFRTSNGRFWTTWKP